MNNKKKKELLTSALREHHAGNFETADKLYKIILETDPNDYDANHLHGTILSQKKQYAKAINFFSIAYKSEQITCELLNNYAIALRNLKAFTECEKLLKEAIILDQMFPNSYLNLSNCYLSQGKLDEAIDTLLKCINLGINVIRCRVEIVSILYTIFRKKHSSIALSNLTQNMEILCKSNNPHAISKCALIFFNIGKMDEALKYFKICEKLFSDDIPNTDVLMNANIESLNTFVKHEYEQIKHIDSDDDGIRNMKITQKFYDNLENLALRNTNDFNTNDFEFISNLHKVKYNKPPLVQKNYLNVDINKSDIEHKYSSSSPEIVVVDNFLTDEFLNELQVFFRCSNIFKYPYSRGYIGAFLGKGMANKAILEFSQELQRSFPKIFFDYYLSQAWAFKYDSKKEGIGIHADDAKVNVNFWITDDSSNLNKNNGGMIIWKKQPKLDATFKDFNSIQSMDKMNKEVKNSDYVKVKYKSNRAVIFNSKLYHVTDEIDFKDNYKDRRVNVTFLYK